MTMSSVTVWANGVYRCAVIQSGGQFDLRLTCQGRLVRQQGCESTEAATRLASEWRAMLTSGDDQ
jgi:hypothetical protein